MIYRVLLQNSGTPRNVVTNVTMSLFVLGRGGDMALKQDFDDLIRSTPIPCQFKNQPDIGRGFFVRLYAAIPALLVAVRTGLTLILAAPELHILGAFVLDRQVPAVKFADQIFERYICWGEIT